MYTVAAYERKSFERKARRNRDQDRLPSQQTSPTAGLRPSTYHLLVVAMLAGLHEEQNTGPGVGKRQLGILTAHYTYG